MTGGAVLVGLVIVVLAATGVIGKSVAVPTEVTQPPYQTPTSLADGRSLGPAGAPVQMVVWSDFQCPVCAEFARTAEPKLISDFVAAGTLRITYRDFIVIDSQVQGGHESRDAATAARCAGDQGKFWPFHDYLFANQYGENKGSFTRDKLLAIASAVGLDTASFTSCLDAGKAAAAVDAEAATGKAIPLDHTPTVMIAGKEVNWSDYAALAAQIRQDASGSAAPSASAGASASGAASPSATP
ncbi:MAG TPA: thioredoxin domain-containing protein [Candidatus Limnocylindrales bacterium]